MPIEQLNHISGNRSLTVAALIGAGTASSFLAWAVRGRSASVFGRSVWRGPRDRKTVALTFDDGPSESTPEILEILKTYNVTATFPRISKISDVLSLEPSS